MDPPTLVTSVSIPSQLTVSTGQSGTLEATVKPAAATNVALAWTSSDSSVASVNSSGVVTGINLGTAQITARTTDGSNVTSNTSTVTVNAPGTLVTSIAIPSTLTLAQGSAANLSATVLPAGASNPAVSWTSSNSSVTTVNASGVVTGVQAGTAQITARATDGSNIVSNICTVTVSPSVVPVSSITLPNSAFVNAGSTVALTATVQPSNATNQTLTWNSSDPTIATVSASGVVTGVQVGTAQVTAYSTDGSNVTSNATAVTVVAAEAAQANNIGINFGSALDWTSNRMFADVMKTSRQWTQVGNWTSPTASVDATGWPTQDASICVWQGIGQMQGTYALSFNGQATIGGSSSTISNQVYDAAHNLTTATLQYLPSDGSGGLLLTFTNTKRTATSSTNTGVTNVTLMRPTAPGSSTTYTNQVFTSQFLSALAPFTVLRAMDFTATNGNLTANWSDRTLPGNASQQVGNPSAPVNTGWQSRGAAWEYAILLANQTHKDLWINIPEHATDDYVTKLAQLIQYGSDGVTPYTSQQVSPVWPALAAGLKVYVEYSNELWNDGATQTYDNRNDAIAEVNAGGSPLNFDGSTSDWFWAWRRTADRTVQISNDFRAVAGDAAMMTRIRPVLMSQLGYSGGPLYQEMHLMVDYYDNASQVSSPKPPNYYIYGVGGSAYYTPADLSSVNSILSTIGNDFVTQLQADADWALAFGLHRIAYEGGPNLPSTGNAATDANQQNAWSDPRMAQAIVNEHNAWSQNAGDLLVYYQLTGDYEWGFMNDVLTPTSPKMSGIATLNSTPRNISSYGAPIPGTLAGTSANIPAPWTSSTYYLQLSNQSWVAYSVQAATAGAYQIVVNAGATSAGAEVEVFVDGASIGTISVSNTGSLTRSADSAALQTPMLSVGSHSILVRAVAGLSQLNQLKVQAAN